jgi:hypothetical protein
MVLAEALEKPADNGNEDRLGGGKTRPVLLNLRDKEVLRDTNGGSTMMPYCGMQDRKALLWTGMER